MILKRESLDISNINGVTYIINSSLNYTAIFPNDFLDSALYDKALINSIIWKVSPIEISSHDEYESVSSFVSLFITVNNQEVIPIDSKIILIQYPVPLYSPIIQESLEWRSYNLNLSHNSIKESNWESSFAPISPCVSWLKPLIVSIKTTHLSSFILISKIPEQLPLK